MLQRGIEALELALTETQIAQLLDYVQWLKKWNRTFNFVSRQDIDRLVSRHVLDSLSACPLLQKGQASQTSTPAQDQHRQKILDIGSGAGLPGVVLAIAAPQHEYVLCDRHSRRVRFLQQTIHRLGLEARVSAVEDDLEGLSGAFHTITARALKPADVLWPKVERLLAVDGQLLVFETTQLPGGEEKQAGTEIEPAMPADVRYSRHPVTWPGMLAVHHILRLTRANQMEQCS